MERWDRKAVGLVAAAHALTWLAVLAFPRAIGLPAGMPLALPGASGLPHATGFNGLAFVLPGLTLAAVAWRARDWLEARTGLAGGIAMRLWLLAALLFALQGLLPLDVDDLDGGASRAHAAVWTAWSLALVAGAATAAFAVPRVRPGSALAAVATVLALALPALAAAGHADRVVLAVWTAWTTWLAWRLPRRAG